MEHGTIDVHGIPTYYDAQGSGPPLLLLHGGMTPNLSWMAQVDELSESYRVVAPERRGHGHTPDVAGPITYDVMCDDMAEFIRRAELAPAHLLGWSDGGIVALLLAARAPELVAKVVAFGANTASAGYQPGSVETLVGIAADSDEAAMFRSMYDPVSPDGPEHFDVVWEKVQELWTSSFDYTAELRSVMAPTLVMVADDDLVTLDHAVEMYRALPNGELAVLPGLSHGAPMERPELFNRLVLNFLSPEAPALLMPYARRHAGHRD